MPANIMILTGLSSFYSYSLSLQDAHLWELILMPLGPRVDAQEELELESQQGPIKDCNTYFVAQYFSWADPSTQSRWPIVILW